MTRVLLVITTILVFGIASHSFADDNEKSCRMACQATYDEEGTITACGTGCDWQMSNTMTSGQCENECHEVFSQSSNEMVAREKIEACILGCNT